MSLSRSWILCFCALSYVLVSEVQGAIEFRGVPNYVVRKCCPTTEYYDLRLQQCVSGGNLNLFESSVKKHLVKGNVRKLGIITGRLLKCPETGECFETHEILSDKTHTLLTNGLVFENFHGVTYDLKNYCLEIVAHGNQNISLAIAYCLPETNVLPKCCPENHFFDTKSFQCIKYPLNDKTERVLKKFFYSKNEMHLQYHHDLECSRTFPVRFSLLRDAYIDECNNICLNSPKKCYSIRKFCIDGAFTNLLEPSVYVCADNVTKVCCKDEFFEENEIQCNCGAFV